MTSYKVVGQRISSTPDESGYFRVGHVQTIAGRLETSGTARDVLVAAVQSGRWTQLEIVIT